VVSKIFSVDVQSWCSEFEKKQAALAMVG